MDGWMVLLDILILLSTAMVLGTICERIKQSAILGYLLAGTLVGPNALNLMGNHATMTTFAELGVALLLFTIGLEFSWPRLRNVGSIAIGGGSLQVLLTWILSTGTCMLLGLEGGAALAVGAAIALSSTACVLRLLGSRAEIDSIYGRNALGILLLQDIAVVPLIILVTVLCNGGSVAAIGWEMGKAIGLATLMVGIFFILLRFLVPRLLRVKEATNNRELPLLLSIVTAFGAAWTSHNFGLSPVFGAFVAGLLLAESPFAVQIRADVAPLRTLFLTLFFSSIGMLSNPAWALEHWVTVVVVGVAIVFGKALVVSIAARLFRSSLGHSVATGVCLAQVGEFSFVIAVVARQGKLISGDLFDLVVSVTIVTLFFTPYLIAIAPHFTTVLDRLSARGPKELDSLNGMSTKLKKRLSGHIVIVGYGPAGQRVAEKMRKKPESLIVVVELNPRSAAKAQASGFRTYIGDATRMEVLDHLHPGAAKAIAITVPNPTTVRQIVQQVRSLAPGTKIIARSRYHIYCTVLTLVGAHAVVDEEEEVGLCIASKLLEWIPDLDSEPGPVDGKAQS